MKIIPRQLLVTAALLALGSVLLYGCGKSDSSDPGLSIDNVPSAHELFSLAIREASKHDSDASLIGIAISVTADRTISSFDFLLPRTPKTVLIVYIHQDGEARMSSEKVEVPVEPEVDEVIESGEWVLDSTDVTKLAFMNGGSDFLETYPQVDRMLIQLGTMSGSAQDRMGIEWKYLAWSVSFHQHFGPSLDFYFDPADGVLIGTINSTE